MLETALKVLMVLVAIGIPVGSFVVFRRRSAARKAAELEGTWNS